MSSACASSSSSGLVRDPADIYSIDWDVLRPLDGWGETSIANLQRAIEASKSQPLARLLVGFNIRHLGPAGAEALAAARGHLDRILDADVETLAAVEGVGPVIAQALHDWLERPGEPGPRRAAARRGGELRGARGGGGPPDAGRRHGRGHRHPRGLQPRGGRGRHQAPGRQVARERVEEDDRGGGRGVTGCVEAGQGHRARRARPRRGRVRAPPRDRRAAAPEPSSRARGEATVCECRRQRTTSSATDQRASKHQV